MVLEKESINKRMNMRFETDLYPIPPYDFERSLGFLGPHCPDPIASFDGKTFRRIWPFGSGKGALVSLNSVGDLRHPQLHLIAEAQDLNAQDFNQIVNEISASFCLELELEPFYNAIKRDTTLYQHSLKNLGLKPVRKPSLFEALTWAIIGQQVNLRFACQVKRGMLEAYAERFQVDDQIFFRYPEPQELVGLNSASWKQFQCSQRKAEYIIGFAEKIQTGLNLTDLKQLSDEQIIEQLTSIRGLGKWTAEYSLIMGFGRWDALPVTDAGLINGIRKVYKMEQRPNAEEIIELAENWRPYRGLATYYLWWGSK